LGRGGEGEKSRNSQDQKFVIFLELPKKNLFFSFTKSMRLIFKKRRSEAVKG
jgi:hypothetical protein